MNLEEKRLPAGYISEAYTAPDPKDLQEFILGLQQIRFKAQKEGNYLLDAVAKGFQNYAARRLISLLLKQEKCDDKKI